MNLLKPPCDEGVIAGRKSATPCSKARGRWILAAAILGSSMVFIDGTVVNVALPALQANLNATSVDVQWVVESYAAASPLKLQVSPRRLGIERSFRRGKLAFIPAESEPFAGTWSHTLRTTLHLPY